MARVLPGLLLGWLLMLGAMPLQARLSIEITEGVEGAIPIAVVPFAWGSPDRPGDDLAEVVSADLYRSGRIAPMARTKLIAQPSSGKEIDFAAWRRTGVEYIVVGRVEPASGGYQVQFQLFDLVRETQLAGYSVATKQPLLRRTAHQISDIVYEKLTGERGAFNTHVVYVMVDQEPAGRKYRLAVADSDGFNEQVILTSKQPMMSPSWSPDGHQLAYVSFEEGRSVVFVQEIASGKRRQVASFNGINSAPAWSPDGSMLALTLSRDGNPEIYIARLANLALTRVTNNRSIDTEPAWAPDGRALYFTSDRGGRPQIYRVGVSGSQPVGNPVRITFEGSYNARAAVSPDGSRLAFVHQVGSDFRIAVMELASKGMRVLTNTRLDESPSFAANGSMIIFATEVNNRGVLEAVSVDGRAHQRLGLQRGDVREPSWSPYIQR